VDVQDTADPLPFQNTDRSQLRIVWRERSTEPVKKRVFMSETGTYPGDITVNEENGYYIVQPTKSIIFLSKGALCPPKKIEYDSEPGVFALAEQPFKIELIVINSVAFDAPFHEELYDWLDRVVDVATSERRNQRVRIFSYLCLIP